MAGRLAQWVLTRASTTARRMREAGFDVPVSVNLSRRQLVEGGVVPCLRRLRDGGMPASALQIEIGEPLLVSDEPRVHQILGDLTALGIGLVGDDFGSGISSLRTLGRVRPHSIKIDGALARELPGSQDAAALVSAVVALARTLGVQLVAEGVETETQSRRLQALGCDELQGYYYGHALADDEWLSYLRWACTGVTGSDLASAGRRSEHRAARGLRRRGGAGMVSPGARGPAAVRRLRVQG
jgi:EAL domain-containing protein (putative c-di-GMP-specific phosphodiesterase class I)